MGVDQTLVMGITIVILFALFVSAFDYIVPMIVKVEFDAICRNYVLIAEAQNGLTDENFINFEEELIKLGIYEPQITCSRINELKRGMVNAVNVEGIYKNNGFISLFKRGDKEIIFNFRQDYLARKIVM